MSDQKIESSPQEFDVEAFVQYHYGEGKIGPHLPCWRGEMAGPRRRGRRRTDIETLADMETPGSSLEKPRRDSDLL